MAVRDRGTTGVVIVSWEIMTHGYNSNKKNDITPARGQIGFLTGESRQNIIVNILADAVPEIDEVHFLFVLTRFIPNSLSVTPENTEAPTRGVL